MPDSSLRSDGLQGGRIAARPVPPVGQWATVASRLIAARRTPAFYAFVLPFAALTIVFGIWPILLSIQVSLTESATALRTDPTYVGLANYISILSDPIFLNSLWRTLLYTLLAVVANVGFALAYALLLHSPAISRGGLFFKAAMFLPVVTPDVAGYVVWRWLFDQSFGAVNAALELVGLPAFGGIASTTTVFPAILIAELWHHAGFYTVIFLANLAICDRSLEEAADIDGASSWQKKVMVILPQLRPAMIINTVYAVIQFLKTFTVIVVMTKGGPNDATNFVSYYAYRLFDQGAIWRSDGDGHRAVCHRHRLCAARLPDRRTGRLAMTVRPVTRILAYATAIVCSVFFLYPYWWMLLGAFRSTEAVLTSPLRLWPESWNLDAFREIAMIGGKPLWLYAINSVVITSLSTVIAVAVTAIGAYALVRKPKLPGFAFLRYGFLTTIMYPYMLLVIPVYIVMFKIGLLGTYAGIILFLALGPVQFFLFEQFFRSIPKEVIEAAIVDGASEVQALTRIVMPMAAPIVSRRLASSRSCSTGPSGFRFWSSRALPTPTRCRSRS